MSLSNTRDRFDRHSNMVLIPVYNIYHLRLQASLPQTPTHERGVRGYVSSVSCDCIFVMLALNFCPVVALDPSMFPPTLDHCLDTLSNYGSPGRETCTAKFFSLRLGVLSGFVIQHRSLGDTTLSERGYTVSVP